MSTLLPAPHDPAEVEGRLWRDWDPGDLALEVGANQGQSLPRVLERFERVIAFEPAEESFEVMERDWGNNPRVTLDRRALASVPGKLTLAVRTAPILTGQLVALGMPYRGEDRGPATAHWGDDAGTRVIEATTLDELAAEHGSAAFAKIDTEGHELEVLHGGLGVLERGVTSFLIEFHTESRHDGCEALLRSHGYDVRTIRHPHYVPGSSMFYQHGWLRAVPPPHDT